MKLRKALWIAGVTLFIGGVAVFGAQEIARLHVLQLAATGQVNTAVRLSNLVLGTVDITNGRQSARSREYKLEFANAIASNTPYFLSSAEIPLIALNRLGNSIEDDLVATDIYIQGSRLGNAAFMPDTAIGLARKAMDRLERAKVSDSRRLHEAQIERAYAWLQTMPGGKNPVSAIKNDYLEANALLCPDDPLLCRFNEARLSIGICIRNMVIEGASDCIAQEVMKGLDRKKICADFADVDCSNLIQRLQPYLLQLLSLSTPKGEISE